MIKEIIRTERGLYGITHTYVSYIEIPDEVIKPDKPKKKAKKDAMED